MSKRKMSWLLWIRNSPPGGKLSRRRSHAKKAELEERKSGYDREQLDSLTASGGDPRRLEEIHSRLAYIGGEIKYINETKALIIEYLKDKREMLDKVPDWTAESLRLQQIIHGGTGGN